MPDAPTSTGPACRPSPQDPQSQAVDALLNKGSKLRLAREAVLAQDLAELARADREKVRRFEEQRLFGGKAAAVADEPVGDIIVCDDYHRNDPPVSVGAAVSVGQPAPAAAAASRHLLTTALAVALAGASSGLAFLAGQRLTSTPAAPTAPGGAASAAAPTPARPSQVTIERKSGFIIDLPGAAKE